MEHRGTDDPLIEIDEVSKHFDTTVGVTDRLLGRDPRPVRAVEDVSMTIEEGDVVGIAGESGCGKTTLGNLLVNLHDPTEGTIRFDGMDLTEMDSSQESAFRKRVQMIFQDPFESLNPRKTVFDSVAEPLRINDIGETYSDRRERVASVLEDVELQPAERYIDQFPGELSGGERQRVAIARALVVDPDFVVADEPVSMLDVSIRAGVLNLLKDLQEEYGLTYVFISHDLSLINYMTEKTAIMYLGDVIEYGETDELVSNPEHPYTKALFEAVPRADPTLDRQRANVTGEVPNARDPPSGCKFHPRCPSVIPPDSWSGSQEAYRRLYQFRNALAEEELDRGDVTGEDEDLSESALVDRLLEHGLELDVPEEHRKEGEEIGEGVDLSLLDMPEEALAVLRDAARDLLEGDYDRGVERIDERYQSVCATTHPTSPSETSDPPACLLFDGHESARTEG
ncbi:MAG: oligopeptide/dipeptide ABC transporter ATP-binding protein [Halanaeroarchaeum sp.]